MNEKLVSIILPTYNGEKYIYQSIESCLKQSYNNLELIIVDDCSKDRTAEIVHSFEDRRIMYFRHEKNMGLANSLNTGLKNSSGQYLTWTSDDNFYHKKAIEIMADFLEKKKSISFVYSNFHIIDEEGKLIKDYRVKGPNTLNRANFLGVCFLYKREVYEKTGEYLQEMNLQEDYNYWLRVRSRFKMEKTNDFLYYYRKNKNSLTWSNKLLDIMSQVEKASKDYIPESYNFLHKGQVFFYQGKNNKAREYFLKAVLKDPRNFYAFKFLVFTVFKHYFPGLADKIKNQRN